MRLSIPTPVFSLPSPVSPLTIIVPERRRSKSATQSGITIHYHRPRAKRVGSLFTIHYPPFTPSIIFPMPLSTEISQIIRSKRKTYSLEVKPDGQLIVRAPESATRAEINAVVKAKAAWIEKTRARLAAKPAMPPPKTFTPGEKFWYLGKQ